MGLLSKGMANHTCCWFAISWEKIPINQEGKLKRRKHPGAEGARNRHTPIMPLLTEGYEQNIIDGRYRDVGKGASHAGYERNHRYGRKKLFYLIIHSCFFLCVVKDGKQ